MIIKYPLYKGKIILGFDDSKHAYSVDGKPVWGVTSIVGVIAKPALMYWAVNQAINFLQDNLQAGKIYDEMQIKNLLTEAKSAHTKAKNGAADIGTMIHEWIEKFLKAGLERKPLPKKPLNKEMKNAIDGFLDWTKKNKVKFLASEQKIYSRKYKYAGTLDAEAMVNGKRAIVDFKTGSRLYPEYFLQSTAYLYARREETGEKYDGGVYTLRLSKESKEQEIEAFEVRKSENLTENFRAFLGCLVLYRWQMENKRREILNQFNQ